jgi:twitching motility protein PilT
MDPDIILVGEMRDLETIHAAIEAAETGHIVFATLHTSGAASTINRIIDVFPKEAQDQIRTQLSTALIGVLSQTLMPKKPDGLVAAYEMMVITPGIQNMIRENKIFNINSAIQTGRKYGMFLLDDHLFRLWKDGTVAKEECLIRASNPGELARKISQAEKGIMEEEPQVEDDLNNGEDAPPRRPQQRIR